MKTVHQFLLPGVGAAVFNQQIQFGAQRSETLATSSGGARCRTADLAQCAGQHILLDVQDAVLALVVRQ